MLKRIRVEDVRLGMYIHGFAGSWFDHPFWRNRFLLDDPADLERIRSSAVREVWIDVRRGADVPASVAVAEAVEAPEAEAEAATQAEPQPEVCAAQAEAARTLAGASASARYWQELQRAARLLASARAAVQDMFQDVRMGRAIDRQVMKAVAEEIAASVERHAGALISLVRVKSADEYTYLHSVAVCALMVALARQLGLPDEQARAAGFAGLLHDVGKADIPLQILNKPGRLTEEEFAIVREHPRRGWQRLRAAGIDDESALDVCLHHHERMDGGGYPDGLAGEAISLMARMGAVCDVYDAITSNRPYKAGWDPAESLKRMATWKGHFDERIFQAFVRSLGIYPVGSLVRLSNLRLAVVVEQNPHNLLRPVVKTVLSLRSGERLIPERVDLSAPGCRLTIEQREDPAQWKIPDLDEIWSGIPGLGRQAAGV
ncbi:Cyclic di-GMP phosphodiesterase response regulator RpfG [Tepidimonas alkaliphilus]|uniref:Cyclic di-GMP phosphodiesterase response regulator RpfG n=1 Tax=Tepidimonas alkaliphilus TaxID=2588942 RepID=A0A554WBT8_9BURK|nr:HD-GYP domain-containing protein [Tepidimonas alkaliphilus]TSE21026.1 Cyclic di-GMP phosphodiesterase response regulator RpfG [Tepidimonas alkaliphilus]